MIEQYILFSIIVGIASIFILKFKILDFKGTLLSIFMGNIIYLSTGIIGFILVIEFFIISFIFTKYKFKQKRKKGIAQEKEGTRSWTNVIANGFGFTIFALLYNFYNIDLLLIGFITAIAVTTGDTLATEIGLLSKKNPRSIINLKVIEPGTSGGITILGTIAGIFGISIILISSLSTNFLTDYFSILYILIGAFLGIMIDSILGATIQAQYYCVKCNKYTELSTHHNTKNKLVKGKTIIDNNIVNLLSTISGSIIAILLFISL